MTKTVLVTLTENAKTPGAHVGKVFCQPFEVDLYIPKRALESEAIFYRNYTISPDCLKEI